MWGSWLSLAFSLHRLPLDVTGVTSILSINETLFLGTKRGELIQYHPERTIRRRACRFPIFSMDVQGDHLVCGQGDRNVTVWNVNTMTLEHILGPHTGWVQDVLLHESTLYSIGCNCIEVWKDWKKAHTIRIDSSLDACTLSSDLLCMTRWNQTLFAGGVDGRIHAWDDIKKPSMPILAHEGRVKDMVIIQDVLVSAGQDGYIREWEITNDGLIAGKSWDCQASVTALSPLQGTSIAFGTQNGAVGLVNLDSPTRVEIDIVNGRPITCLDSHDRNILVAGHGKGVTTLQIDESAVAVGKLTP